MPALMLDLASQSPRRLALLAQLGVRAQVLAISAIDETPYPSEAPTDYVSRLATAKAKAGQAQQQHARPLLAADTTVFIEGLILGKPDNHAGAAAMLRRLSGCSHQVATAVCLAHQGHYYHALSVSEVSFMPLSEAQIAAYCDTDEPYDKAGGYGIQGYAARFIRHISGSYSGIMGLPLFETAQLLEQAGLANCLHPQ